jgi:DNA uptake protein ComE-like DNA-binding protein
MLSQVRPPCGVEVREAAVCASCPAAWTCHSLLSRSCVRVGVIGAAFRPTMMDEARLRRGTAGARVILQVDSRPRACFVPCFAGIPSDLRMGGILWLIVSPPRGPAIALLPSPSPAQVCIHVAGAGRQPGVNSLPAGSSVEQPTEAARGPADGAWLDAIKLAERPQDGEQVGVPYLAASGVKASSPAATPTPGTPASPVNLNTACASELDWLLGIGPCLAQETVC